MKEALIAIRNNIISFLYKFSVKPICFLIDPEKIHNTLTVFGRILGSNFITRAITGFFFNYHNKKLSQNILGINFNNPVGLAAGFDKDAQLTKILPRVGFGHIEIGSITGEPCVGNPKPRLFRLPKSQSIVVNYGLKNKGAEIISKKLKNAKFKVPIGVSIAKTNCKETVGVEAGITDYKKAHKAFSQIGDFDVINISCPNAHGGEPFTDPVKLEKLLSEIDKTPTKKPIFIKLSPDLTEKELDAVIQVCTNHKIAGFSCANLTKDRGKLKLKEPIPGKGSISGKAIEALANEQIACVYRKTNGKYSIIGVGGIFTAEDAYKKIRLGASLIQLITGMIYGGPQTISQINHGLVRLLEKDGFKNISEAIGADNK